MAMEEGSQAWKKAQCACLEISRTPELEDRRAWWEWEQEQKEAEKREAKDKSAAEISGCEDLPSSSQ